MAKRFSNSKKHYKEGETSDNVLPLGGRYNSKTNKYHVIIVYVWLSSHKIGIIYAKELDLEQSV